MNLSKIFCLSLSFGLLSAQTVQARPQVDGAGIVSADQQTAIVNFGPSLDSGKYTYYRGAASQKRMGTAQIYTVERKSASGTFEEYSLDGQRGCQGTLSLEITTPPTARTQDIRLDARWEIEQAMPGKRCDRIGQSTVKQGLRWGRLPNSMVQAAASLGSGTLTAEHKQTRINVRDGADLTASIEGVGKVGDRVRILDSQFGSDKYLWYRVELNSGATGWVRGDWISPDFASL